MRVLSLFTGIGAHDLGLEWAGMEIVGQVEIDGYCTKVLEKHWPAVPRWTDIKSLSVDDIRCLKPDIITGGFPCQDISVAGKQAGIDGERSGLWKEMFRIIDGLRPDWLLIENVPALRTNGADTVLSALESIGYTCWPLVVGALHVGAPHSRKRVWIVGHSQSKRCKRIGLSGQRRESLSTTPISNADVANTDSQPAAAGTLEGRCSVVDAEQVCPESGSNSSNVSDTDSNRVREQSRWSSGQSGTKAWFSFPRGPEQNQFSWEEPRTIKPKVGSATPGTASRLDGFIRRNQLKAVGNANPPQIAALIGRAIMAINQEAICARRV